MALRSAPLLLLILVTVTPQESRFGNSSHSLKYFYTSISDSSQESPHFVVLGYVDSQVFAHYDSNSRKFQPRVSWIEKVEKKDPQYWEKYTEILRDNEKLFKKDLEKLKTRYNHSNEPKSSLGIIIISCVVAGLVLLSVIVGILVFFKRRQDNYRAALKLDCGRFIHAGLFWEWRPPRRNIWDKELSRRKH